MFPEESTTQKISNQTESVQKTEKTTNNTNETQETETTQTTQNTEIPQTEETNSTYVGEEEKESQNDQAQNETQTKEEKAIELAKKEWGEKDTSVTYTIEQKEGNVYYISVKRGTEVQVWYKVDTDKWTISQY